MKLATHTIPLTRHVAYEVPDLQDCYTWSFPEFLPFCPCLYFFSSFKAFGAAAA